MDGGREIEERKIERECQREGGLTNDLFPS